MIIKALRARAINNPILGALSSLKLTVLCIFLLGVLIFWGTLDQVEHGLYLAQERFFNSLFVWMGPVPIPSVRIIMWVLFFNLLAALSFRFRYSFKNLGLVITHIGLVMLLVSGFLTLHFSRESFVNLYEGESTNIASDYMNWELVIVSEEHGKIGKLSIDEQDLIPGKVISAQGLILPLKVRSKYINSHYFDTPFAGRILKEMPLEKDYEKNVRALILDWNDDEIKLQGDDEPSYSLNYKGVDYVLLLRKKQYKLPFMIELVDVSRELHPGTDKAKSYQSKVVIHEHDLARELTISMNKPFRSGLYTAYQASFGIDADAKEMTVLAIVKNLDYSLPYIASLICSLGLFIHFGQMFLLQVWRKRDE